MSNDLDSSGHKGIHNFTRDTKTEENNEEKESEPENNTQAQGKDKEKGKEQEFDIPFDYGLAQNSRISELQKGSSGTGKTKDTATHLYNLESFKEGKLSRERKGFLCKGEGKNPTVTETEYADPKKVTCQKCSELMERWKTSEEDTDLVDEPNQDQDSVIVSNDKIQKEKQKREEDSETDSKDSKNDSEIIFNE